MWLDFLSGDVFDIGSRLKEIDDGYAVAYNRKLKRFEVHNLKQRGDTLSVVLPYSTLDSRALTHVQYTRIERRKQVLEEIERHNERKERESVKKSLDKVLAENEEYIFG